MYTLKILGPALLSLCGANFVEGQGELCNIDQRQPPVVKYYEPGKSCYFNGTFYRNCEDRHEGV